MLTVKVALRKGDHN